MNQRVACPHCRKEFLVPSQGPWYVGQHEANGSLCPGSNRVGKHVSAGIYREPAAHKNGKLQVRAK